jgi:hypothetical protein
MKLFTMNTLCYVMYKNVRFKKYIKLSIYIITIPDGTNNITSYKQQWFSEF